MFADVVVEELEMDVEVVEVVVLVVVVVVVVAVVVVVVVVVVEVVEVVHDDGDKQVEHQEGADHEEADEEGVGHVGATALLLASIVRLRVTDCSLAVK